MLKRKLLDFPYLSEFLTIATISFIAMASPGPDFAIVVRNALKYGKKAGFMTAVGISTGLYIHVAYTLLGIGIVIAQSIVAFTILKIIGAGYLIYIGIKCIKARPDFHLDTPNATGAEQPILKSFKTGFLTNALNPKVTLTFLSLFSVVVSPTTPLSIQALYGVWMSLSSLMWFTFLTYIFANPTVRQGFKKFGHWIERTTGAAMITIGVQLAFIKNQ